MLDCRWEDGTGGRPRMMICVRVVRRERHRCPHCGRRGSGYDQGLARWMKERDYASVDEMRGCMNLSRCPNPATFERGNYMRILQGPEP